MIALLNGTIIEKTLQSVVVDVRGVGYEVLVPANDHGACLQGEQTQLYTYFHVRENSQELFGFLSQAAKQLFQQLIRVNGVGPKGALNIMGLGDEQHIRQAIANEDIAFITGASGIGKKAAQKIVLDLRDKMGVLAGAQATASGSVSANDEAYEALQALGFNAQQARTVLSGIDAKLSVQARIKMALKELQS